MFITVNKFPTEPGPGKSGARVLLPISNIAYVQEMRYKETPDGVVISLFNPSVSLRVCDKYDDVITKISEGLTKT
jgi:hypothetical protein